MPDEVSSNIIYLADEDVPEEPSQQNRKNLLVIPKKTPSNSLIMDSIPELEDKLQENKRTLDLPPKIGSNTGSSGELPIFVDEPKVKIS